MTDAVAMARSGRDLLHRLSERREMPIGVHLQVADRCNHTCQHCYQIQGMKGEMSFEDVCRVLDDLAAAGVLTLNVSGGEATLRHDLVDILKYARGLGFALRLYTNAFLVDDAYADRLASLGLHEVHVSVYSAVAAEHDAVTRVPGSHARTMAGIRALRARRVRVVMKSVATSLSSEGTPGVQRVAQELGCAFQGSASITPMEDGSLASLAVAATPEKLVASGVLKPWKPADDPTREVGSYRAGASCGVGQSGMVVLPDGDVLPCTDTPLRLGNVLEQSFGSVTTSSDARFFRGLTWASVHGCRDCDLMPGCHRCHATALHEGGDYLGPYPSGCAHARARYGASVGPVELLPPAEGCEPGRDLRMGPYKIESEGRLRPVADARTADDDALALRHPWIRRHGEIQRPENGLVPASTLVRSRAGSGIKVGDGEAGRAPRHKFRGV